MNSQSNSLVQERAQANDSVPPAVLKTVTELVNDLHGRYTAAATRVGDRTWLYTDLLRMTTQMRTALSGPNPVGEMRALVVDAPSESIGEIVDGIVALLEGVGR